MYNKSNPPSTIIPTSDPSSQIIPSTSSTTASQSSDPSESLISLKNSASTSLHPPQQSNPLQPHTQLSYPFLPHISLPPAPSPASLFSSALKNQTKSFPSLLGISPSLINPNHQSSQSNPLSYLNTQQQQPSTGGVPFASVQADLPSIILALNLETELDSFVNTLVDVCQSTFNASRISLAFPNDPADIYNSPWGLKALWNNTVQSINMKSSSSLLSPASSMSSSSTSAAYSAPSVHSETPRTSIDTINLAVAPEKSYQSFNTHNLSSNNTTQSFSNSV